MNTKNKIALITGGSRGLGRNMALAIAKKGIDVMLTYHTNKEAADEVVAEIESLGKKPLPFSWTRVIQSRLTISSNKLQPGCRNKQAAQISIS